MGSQFPELAALKVLGGINKIANSISRILCRLCDILYKKVPEIRQASVRSPALFLGFSYSNRPWKSGPPGASIDRFGHRAQFFIDFSQYAAQVVLRVELLEDCHHESIVLDH